MADAPAPHALVMQFVAALLQRTLGCATGAAHQHALQGSHSSGLCGKGVTPSYDA